MTTAPDRVAAIADLIADVRLHPRRLDCLPQDLRPRDVAEAYAVQLAVHDRLARAGRGRRAGWKIGCTTRVMQDFLGIDRPCAGGMFDRDLHQSGARFRHADMFKPGIECEIAVRLKTDVPMSGAPFDRDTIAAYVGEVMAAAELVDERFTDFRAPKVDAPTLIAEDFFHVGAILGPPIGDWPSLDLAALTGRTTIDGSLRGEGRGADVMGHPFAALAWLANHLAGFGLALNAGDTVLTGSVVVTQYPDGPGEVTTEIDRLGRVEIGFD